MRKVKCIVNPWRGLSIEHPMYTLVIVQQRNCFDQEFHRCMLYKLLQAITLLGKEGLAFRGHDESSEAF